MPKAAVVHYNPPETKNKTRCGRVAGEVQRWSTDPHDATCNSCVRLIKKDVHLN